MFNFFTTKRWALWGLPGAILIAIALYIGVAIEVKINRWFRTFYDIVGDILAGRGVDIDAFYASLLVFAGLAGVWVMLKVVLNFFTSHWTFRWRTSMAEKYHQNFGDKPIEGASQRVQEDTLKFSRLMEDLGSNLVEAIISVALFTPLLIEVGGELIVPFFMPWIDSHPLVWAAIYTSVGGAFFMFLLGIKLPGLEYDIQAKEAAYRKDLVYLEDNTSDSRSDFLSGKYQEVKSVHYRSYLHYFYFNAGRWSFLQFNVIVPYLIMAPSIVGGLLTLGMIQQIAGAFRAVAGNLQYLIRSWPQIVELLSVVKRLREYERNV